MYKEFYLMQKEPFDSHPSPELFYKSVAHQNGWSYLVNGIRTHEPILLVEGEYGAGKTLLYLKLIRLFRKNKALSSVFVSTPTYNFVMVLEKIIETLLGIPASEIDTSDESRLQQVIYDYFEKSEEDRKEFIYVVIDDAQEFSYSFINKLRLFVSYNVAGRFPIRLVLFAHHSFGKMLEYKKLVALGQRIKRIYHLRGLNFDETREYIYFRLIYSGASGTPVFDDEAVRLIQGISKGNPRLINNVCDNCLLLASSEKCNLINSSLVEKTMQKGGLMGFDAVKPMASDSVSAPGPAGPGQMPAPRHPGPQHGPAVSVQKNPHTPEPPVRAPKPQRQNTGYDTGGQPSAQAPQQHPPQQQAPVRQPPPRPAAHAGTPGPDPQARTAPYPNPGQASIQPGPQYTPPKPKTANSQPAGKKRGSGFKGAKMDETSLKKGVVAVLVIIIILLVVFLFNSRMTKEEYDLQGSNIEFHRQVPSQMHSIGNGRMLGQKGITQVYKSRSAIQEKRESDGFQPIIHMEKLM